ncbi:signal peptidase I [Christensenellaceae bacterium OttesenSCG-928-L17]|nr:signal peptidase I [Christensenellaceae bacterium OttesenSCG-928-L17]
MKQKQPPVLTVDTIEKELRRSKYKTNYWRVLRSTVSLLIVVAAVAILISSLMLPVFRMYGSSMTDTLYDGEIVAAVKGSNFVSGDIIAFYYNNEILVKRVIATAGQWVDIDAEGNVYVDEVMLDEPYVTDKALGDCNITLPYQVPDGRIFVMGDHRVVSLDSRNTAIGCIAQEQIAGKLVLRVWPFDAFGRI